MKLEVAQNIIEVPVVDKAILLKDAKKYLSSGLSVIVTNKSKAPIGPWKQYQKRLASIAEIECQLSHKDACGLGIICGAVSGNLEVIDDDSKYDISGCQYKEYCGIVEDNAPGLISTLRRHGTLSGGNHLLYRCPIIEGNQKLAQRLTTEDERNGNQNDKVRVLFETRGEGGFVVCPPTNGYSLENDVPISTITEEQRGILLDAARYFNQVQEDLVKETSTIKNYGSRVTPWEDYNAKADHVQLLVSHDWTIVKQQGERVILRRPGKEDGTSGDYHLGKRLFKVFSTSTEFEAGKGYTGSAIFAFLVCNGDFKQSTKKLIEMGYGEKIPRESKTPVVILPKDEVASFPYTILPDCVRVFIELQSIQGEYLAGAILVALATAIGNSVILEAMPGYSVKPIIYMAIVAPPGASKSPALKKAFAPIEEYDAILYTAHKKKVKEYEEQFAQLDKDKKGKKPTRPELSQVLVKDSTIEMVVKILSFNKQGVCVLADELSGFMKRMNQYKEGGDETQKWLEMWSGSPLLLQRITRDENKVQEPFCQVIGGIQPGVLEALSNQENEHNGFFHRFVFIYPVPKKKEDWKQIIVPTEISKAYNDLFQILLSQRNGEEKNIYHLSVEANLIYAEWFNTKNSKYNSSFSDQVKGIIAKYQDYCLRFALLLQVIYDGENRAGTIGTLAMENAIILTEYFLTNINKAIKILTPEHPSDKLQPPYDSFYRSLPEEFSSKEAIGLGEMLKIPSGTVKSFISRNAKLLFEKIDRGNYSKI